VGLARGVLGRPYLFTQTRDYLQTGRYQKPLFSDIVKIALKQARLMQQAKGPHGMIEMRKHLGWYVHDFPGARTLRNKLYTCSTFAEIEEILLENISKFG